MNYIEGELSFTPDQTRQMAESWKRRYSSDRRLRGAKEGERDEEYESDLESDHFSEEYGAEGRVFFYVIKYKHISQIIHDLNKLIRMILMIMNYKGDESHTATEGEDLGDDDNDEDREMDKKARELRQQELNINFNAPPCESETSDSSNSGSDTEVSFKIIALLSNISELFYEFEILLILLKLINE